MKVAVFNAASHDRQALERANLADGHPRHLLTFTDARLRRETVDLAAGSEAVAITVHDAGDAATLQALHHRGVRLVALRSKGFDHVDLDAARGLGMQVSAASDYSPHSVAEHTMALLLATARHLPRAHARLALQDFRLEGLVGFELHGRRIGVVGTGRIGSIVARILTGFGCLVMACDPNPAPSRVGTGVPYVPLAELLRSCEVVTLHCPLNPSTRHMIDGRALDCMPARSVLVNTSRGAVVDTDAVIGALLSGHLAAFAADVLEGEGAAFGRDLSETPLSDPIITRLLGMPNVLVTPHQAFLTREALDDIARAVLDHCSAFEAGLPGRERLVMQM